MSNDLKGTLAPKSKREIALTFCCDEAKVIVATIVCKLTEGPNDMTRVIKLSGVGKYPFITCDTESIDFETLLVGKTEEREVRIYNSSHVPTQVKLERVSDDGKDPSISLSATSGTIEAHGKFLVTIKYTPKIPGVSSCAYFKVSSQGGNELNFNAKGQAEGYNVELSAKTVHFGEVQIEQSTNRLLNVCNNSALPTTFQFISDKSNVFSFSMTEGSVKPFS